MWSRDVKHSSSLTRQREWPYLWGMRLPGCTCNKGTIEHFDKAQLTPRKKSNFEKHILHHGRLLTSYRSILSGDFHGVAEKKTIFIQIFPQTVNKHEAWHKTPANTGSVNEQLVEGTWVVPRDARSAPKCLPQQRRVFLAVLYEHFLQRLRPV